MPNLYFYGKHSYVNISTKIQRLRFIIKLSDATHFSLPFINALQILYIIHTQTYTRHE